MARVSWPSLASLKPVEWRSMCGWIGMPKLGGVAGASEQLAERRCGHRRATLGDEDIGVVWVFTQHLAQGPEFRPAQRMGAGQPVLAAAHMQQALPKIQLLAPQADQFRDTEPVPVGEQDHRGVAVAVASEALRRGDQPVDFRRCQVFPAAPFGVGNLGRGAHAPTFPKTMFGERSVAGLQTQSHLT